MDIELTRQLIESNIMIKNMHYENGEFELELKYTQVMEVLVELFLNMLGNAPNYVETKMTPNTEEMTLKLGDADGVVVTVRRYQGQTPNQLKMKAEEELKQANKLIELYRTFVALECPKINMICTKDEMSTKQSLEQLGEIEHWELIKDKN